MDDRFKVVCGACQCVPMLMSDADGEVVVCPGCGQKASADEVYRIAGEHHALGPAEPDHMPLTEQTFRWQAVRP